MALLLDDGSEARDLPTPRLDDKAVDEVAVVMVVLVSQREEAGVVEKQVS